MSREYDKYLEEYIRNVKRGYDWLRINLPQLFEGDDISWKNIDENDFNKAWLLHIRQTRQVVEDILWELRGRLGFNVLAYHAIKGDKGYGMQCEKSVIDEII